MHKMETIIFQNKSSYIKEKRVVTLEFLIPKC
jgi:hypothetical protein